MEEFAQSLKNIVWGQQLVIMLIGISVFLTFKYRFYPFKEVIPALVSSLFHKESYQSSQEKALSPFQALMTALSSTVGTGNIIGVALGIIVVGPGVVFWMWIFSLFGMVLKLISGVAGMIYREQSPETGRYFGGPMYYIAKTFPPRFAWAGSLYALLLAVSGLGMSMPQVHSISGNLLDYSAQFPALPSETTLRYMFAGLITFVTGLVIIGGVRRIAEFATLAVPFMIMAYILACSVVIVSHLDMVPSIIAEIFHRAFIPETAVVGGFIGVLQEGAARGVFSSGAGMGTSSVAHAQSSVQNPVAQGRIAMTEPFLDTIIICTMTALSVLIYMKGGDMTVTRNPYHLINETFSGALPFIGRHVIPICIVIFAFTSMITACFYSESGLRYIFGPKVIPPFRIFWCAVVFVGCLFETQTIWAVSDALLGLIVYPNLIAMLFCAPIVYRYLVNSPRLETEENG